MQITESAVDRKVFIAVGESCEVWVASCELLHCVQFSATELRKKIHQHVQVRTLNSKTAFSPNTRLYQGLSHWEIVPGSSPKRRQTHCLNHAHYSNRKHLPSAALGPADTDELRSVLFASDDVNVEPLVTE